MSLLSPAPVALIRYGSACKSRITLSQNTLRSLNSFATNKTHGVSKLSRSASTRISRRVQPASLVLREVLLRSSELSRSCFEPTPIRSFELSSTDLVLRGDLPRSSELMMRCFELRWIRSIEFSPMVEFALDSTSSTAFVLQQDLRRNSELWKLCLEWLRARCVGSSRSTIKRSCSLNDCIYRVAMGFSYAVPNCGRHVARPLSSGLPSPQDCENHFIGHAPCASASTHLR